MKLTIRAWTDPDGARWWRWTVRDVDGAVLTQGGEPTWVEALLFGVAEAEHTHRVLAG